MFPSPVEYIRHRQVNVSLSKLKVIFVGFLFVFVNACGGTGGGGDGEWDGGERDSGDMVDGDVFELERIEVSPSSVVLFPGETFQFVADGFDEMSRIRDVTDSVEWSSGDESVVATTETPGLVMAEAPGVSTVTASSLNGAVSGEAVVTVLEVVEVSHEREFRGAWVATAWGINFPSNTSSMTAQQDQLRDILDGVEEFGMNAVVFQVRPESDAFYESELEPWSRFLTGAQGEDPGYDPLAFLIEEAHERNIEVHAWLNPYRALVNRHIEAVWPHVSLRYPEYAYPWGDNLLWMDPGAVEVRDHIVDVVTDIVRGYNVDGIHFDDYFYPWPISGHVFPDGPLYNEYVNSGGEMSLADWRRDNVNEMVRLVGEAVAAEKPHVRFGVGPFGIYKTGEPPGITGTSQYDVLFSDPKKWIQERWVDYVAPQLYWPTTSSGQPYGTLLPWWAGLSSDGHYIFAGNALYRLGDSSAWTVNEFRLQVEIGRDYRHMHSMGNIFYHVANILSDRQGVATMLLEEFYSMAALTPPVVAVREREVSPPRVEVVGVNVSVRHDAAEMIRAWVVYAWDGEGWVIHRIVPSAESVFVLSSGTWAVSAACWGNVESLGVVVDIF